MAAMAAGGGQVTTGTGTGGLGVPPPQKSDMSPLLQQLNLESIRTRTQDLFNAISAILHSFQTIPQHKWYLFHLIFEEYLSKPIIKQNLKIKGLEEQRAYRN